MSIAPGLNRRKVRYYRLLWLKHDLPAGLTVFFVALPLCLGIALASGAPLYSGILSGIIGGMVVTLISDSRVAVSGPAAGLATIVAAAILSAGDYRVFLVSVVLAGILQVLMGAFKLGTVSNYFPSAVIRGMLCAIGILLISKQIPLALGYNQPDFWSSGFIPLLSAGNFLGDMRNFTANITPGAILISMTSLLILILMQLKAVRQRLYFLPAPLLVVVAGILVNLLLNKHIPLFALDKGQLVSIPKNIFSQIVFPDFTQVIYHPDILKNAVVIAILASLETLLCVEAIDKLDPMNSRTNINRELVAQGVGNTLCGLLGAIPMTAVIVRGAANIEAGARTKMASFTHGLFLLVAVLAFPLVLNQIPYACLAAILLMTGYNLSKPALYKRMFRLGWNQFLPFIFTIVVILATDLLIGVSVGLLMAFFYIIQNNLKDDFDVTKRKEHETEHYTLHLNSNVTFLNKVKLKAMLEQIPDYAILTIDGTDVNFIDHDVLEIISEFESQAKRRHIEVQLVHIQRVDVVGH